MKIPRPLFLLAMKVKKHWKNQFLPVIPLYCTKCSRGGIGRRKGLKIPRSQGCAGSSPAASTIYKAISFRCLAIIFIIVFACLLRGVLLSCNCGMIFNNHYPYRKKQYERQ